MKIFLSIVIILILAAVAFFAFRSVVKNRASGGCDGDCASCERKRKDRRQTKDEN